MAGYTVNPKEWSLDLGPSDPWMRLWIVVNPKRQRDKKIPHDVGGEIQWHPCLFLPSDLVEIMVKPAITCVLCWPSDLVWIAVKPCFY